MTTLNGIDRDEWDLVVADARKVRTESGDIRTLARELVNDFRVEFKKNRELLEEIWAQLSTTTRMSSRTS